MNISKFVGMSLTSTALLVLAGCTTAPTYGTGKRSDVQLLEDVANLASLGPKGQERIEYTPRGALVKPPQIGTLPAPQTAFANSDQWPESPEERLARLRQEATDNQNNPLYRSAIINTGRGAVNTNGELTPEQQSERFRQQLAAKNGAYEGRRYLSDPPVLYKAPVESAPVDDLGEDEKVKERRRLKAAKKNDGFKIGDLWPF